MKPFLFALILITAISCGGHASKKDALKGEPPSEDQILVGEIDRNDLLAPPHDEWFNAHYDGFAPDHEAMEIIRKHIHEFDSIRVFMGTWCIDSRIEVPKLFKILDESDYDFEKVKITSLEWNKTAPDNLEKTAGVIMIPTMIFYKNGQEANRFVEYPRETFEQDLAKIVSGSAYRHSYLE